MQIRSEIKLIQKHFLKIVLFCVLCFCVFTGRSQGDYKRILDEKKEEEQRALQKLKRVVEFSMRGDGIGDTVSVKIFDEQGRCVHYTRYDGSGNKDETEYTFDKNGNIISYSIWTKFKGAAVDSWTSKIEGCTGQVLKYQSERSGWYTWNWKYEYTKDGLLSKKEGCQFVHNKLSGTYIPESSNDCDDCTKQKTKYEYDKKKNLLSETVYNYPADTTIRNEIKYEYEKGLLWKRAVYCTGDVLYYYDFRSRLIQEFTPMHWRRCEGGDQIIDKKPGKYDYKYNEAGDMEEWTLGFNILCQYKYDVNHNILQIKYVEKDEGEPIRTTYFSLIDCIFTYEYDSGKRITKKIQTFLHPDSKDKNRVFVYVY